MTWQNITDWSNRIMESLPMKLLVIQVKLHVTVLALWLVLLGVINGIIASDLGGAYLLLEPEYLGEENFWSTFLVGSALGAFLFAYMITIYIGESYRFHFIAFESNPFITFSYNNFLVPGIFLFWYFYRFLQFHVDTEGSLNWVVIEKFLGLFLGIFTVFLFSASFFFARRSLTGVLERFLSKGWEKGQGRRNRRVILKKARASFRAPLRAKYYVRFPFQVVDVGSMPPVAFRTIVQNLNQRHERLLLVQILTFILIVILGLLEEHPFMQIPAGASMLLVMSLALMLFGAITFWYRKLGLVVILIFLALFFIFPKIEAFKDHHFAFGLDYQAEPVAYTHETIDCALHPDSIRADRQYTLNMLSSWRKWKQEVDPGREKPQAVFLMASGGGLRSAFWTFRMLQHVDSVTQGRLAQDVRLITGASGGMIGLAYYRELQLQRIQGNPIVLHDPKYRENISKDLLNRVFFKTFTDKFLPNFPVEIAGKRYDKESGYSFDHQLSLNMPEFAGRRLGDYIEWEQKGMISPVVITPTILNQGRRLFVSSVPISFLVQPYQVTPFYETRSHGVEFRRLFAQQQPDSLRLITALRMNATFPFILPIVSLPSNPQMLVMDAGAIDNYGSPTAIHYLFEFRKWFERNTERVIFIQLRDNVREDPIEDFSGNDIISQQLTPLGNGYYSMAEAKDLTSDYLFATLKEWYGGEIELISFEYPRETLDAPASLSFHLTRREKENILTHTFTPSNLSGIRKLKELYKPNSFDPGKVAGGM
ncbi:MAG: patatin-like phospholipase family protein [Bacteroidota bacterium]